MKTFYDLGTHLFEGLLEFNKHFNFDNTWKIYCFEANPHTYAEAKKKLETHEFLKTLNIDLINAAISDTNGTTEFECYYDLDAESYIDVGSTAFNLRGDYFKEIHKDASYAKMGEKYCQVENIPTVDFSDFLRNNSTQGDIVIIKMDIEGCEFVTIEKMLKDKTHTLVAQMFIEWHERFWPAEQVKYTNLKNTMLFKLANDGVDAKIWW
jgi:FkbM family methyltransferase